MLQHSLRRWILVLILSFSTLMMTGCQGCREKEKTAEEKKKEELAEKERKKPNFELKNAIIYPGQYSDSIRKNRTKRGHWVTVDFRVVANKFDTQGELSATSYGNNVPIPVESTDYFAVTKRPFSITKNDLRNIETQVYIPRRDSNQSIDINYSMTGGSGGLAQLSDTQTSLAMKANQFHLIVLTNRPDSYGYVNVIDSIKMPYSSETGTAVPLFYSVVRTNPGEEPIALPRNALSWTTIGYLIWDNLNVDQLDADQQQALVDWLHFGGQLIVSGPDSLDKLSNSFLGEYLPAKFSASKNLIGADVETLNEHWSLSVENQPTLKRNLVVTPKTPLIGVEFEPHADATFVDGTGSLAIERQIGRGRIVVTAFSLDDKPLIRWPGYPSFFNGCLLRRPGRKFGETQDGALSFVWKNDDTSIFDPLIGSTLRYLSRDLSSAVSERVGARGTPLEPGIPLEQIATTTFLNSDDEPRLGYLEEERFRPRNAAQKETRNLDDHWHYGGYQHDQQAGTAGWNDRSGISLAAQETLKRAAGISPPSSDFVLKMLAVYLIVLVPVNWLVFRLIGRVEWAWIAAPFIAVGGALMVAKMASLDIGFVRSNSQVACIEVFSDYPRAHVAQYSALYTSLSTGYDIDLDNSTAQSLPLGGLRSKRRKQKSLSPVVCRKTIDNRLEGFQVQSNSTGMLHTEMMLDLQGVFSQIITDKKTQIRNATVLNLEEAAVVRRTVAGELKAAWIGDLASRTQSPDLDFQSIGNPAHLWPTESELGSQFMANRLWARLNLLEQISEVDDGEETDEGGPLGLGGEPESTPPTQYVLLDSLPDQLPEMQERWPEFKRLAARMFPELTPVELMEMPLNFQYFRALIDQWNLRNDVHVGRLFQCVSQNLQLAPGETRLIAMTAQPIGENSFDPASTQTRQRSLVVVHLQRPPLPTASGDVNAIEDFDGRSNLDALDELRQMEDESERIEIEPENDPSKSR